ncbi:MAG: hypothetical protein LBJ88_04815 [Campylobacteraceae bacterium]|jgi:hypothetical protein|nr:hypothetical protein [Campylobacteraceae bacterium]
MSNEFTDNELKSIAINAVGRSSEAGSKAIMRIGLAVPEKFLVEKDENGKVYRTGKIKYPPEGAKDSINSGFSVGVLQWDIGQQKNGKEILEIYNDSEHVKNGGGAKIAEDKVDEYTLILQQNRDTDRFGKKNSGEERYDVRRGEDKVSDYYRNNLTRPLNNFFVTNEGYKFVMSLQEKQYNTKLESEMKAALESPSVQNMSRDDAVGVLAAIAKEKNQAGFVHKDVKALLDDKEKLHTKDEIAKQIYSAHGKYVEDGVKKTLEGAELYNTLYNDKGKLGEIFREQNGKNPFEIEDFHKSPNDQLIDAMFRNPKEAEKLIEAVNNNKEKGIINIENEKNNRDIEKEVYIVGVRDGTIFTAQEIVENGKVLGVGKGYKLENNEWKEFDNNKEKFLGNSTNNNLKVEPIYKDITELSPEMTEFMKKIAKQDTLSEEFKSNLVALQNTFKLCDEKITDYTLNPTVTKEELQEFAKEHEAKELAEAQQQERLANKDKDDDDNVRRMEYRQG